ncbi:LPS-assembly protein LptD [Nitrosophilus alvini]|uniref:LPS-assembly protein LptD n=1 Tax=Nitrosophilus alvini TaxID=2714855 RepID=UPI00190DBABE|nr:LPS assembly protein LptD [Nitrosophilus alvini]
MRFFVLICLSFVAVFAKDVPVEILAKDISALDGKIIAQEDVVIFYEDFYIQAQKAIYDKNSSTIELFGDIDFIKGSRYHAIADYALFDLANEKIYTKPFFYMELDSRLWISAEESCAQKGIYELDNSIVSSCDPADPDWRLEFSSGEYDTKKKWINLYNVRLYASNIPLLYTPYLGFSTSKERKSGLLRPSMGMSGSEGFLYFQPIYFAPDLQWDLEIVPQIRTTRGKGVYTTFRFVDSPVSKGYFRFGGFRENDDYKQEHNLIYKNHVGFEANYERSELFSRKKMGGKDGLYIDINWLNDIDYLNLQESDSYKNLGNIVISRLNYYYNKADHYLGFYSKYFIDTSKTDNDYTMQMLPSLQYHKYLNSFLFKNLLYSLDYKYKNLYREEGINAQQHEFDIPVGFYFSILDDYLGFSVSENIYFTYVDYSNTDIWRENTRIFRNYHKFSIFSDLIKPYDNFLHTLHLTSSLFVPSYEKDIGYKADFITVNSEEKRMEVSLKQYFYDIKGNEFLYHRIIQPVFYSRDYKYGELENEIGYKINSSLSLVNDLFYSHENSRVSSMTTTIRYNDKDYSVRLSHFYKDNINSGDSNYVSANISKNLSQKYKLFAKIDYDFSESYTKEWKIGWSMFKKCWSYTFSYAEEVKPVLTSAGSSSITNRAIFLKINLIPLGGVEYTFKESTQYDKGNN